MTASLVGRLRTALRGEVEDDPRRRAEYSSDASNYRVVPQVVVFPVDTADVLAALEIARETGTAVTARGGGTSVAGNAVGPGVILDFSRHMRRVLRIDPETRSATVEPGVVLGDLQRAAAPYGLRFGPDPSTQARATLGGMIGNNACGPHAVAWGRTADNVRSLDVVDGLGRRFVAGGGDPDFAAVPGLQRLVGEHLGLIRTEFGRFDRQVSGYSMEHLLPEKGSSLAKFLVGTEGTLVTTLSATLDLVPLPQATVLLVLGYPDMPSAADAVVALLPHGALAIEGLDSRLVDVVRAHGRPVPTLPAGAGWLMIEVSGHDAGSAADLAQRMAIEAGALEHAVVTDHRQAAAMWRIREDGAGLAGRTPQGKPAWPGWEDAAVPPERLGSYLRDFDKLLTRYGLTGLPYGHFGDGCIHVRLDLPLDSNPAMLRTFITEAAELVASHGGSLCGEHGDGRARSELLPVMYSSRAIALFSAVKDLFDPHDNLNPGVLVRPRPLDADLRRPAAPAVMAAGGFAFAEDGGDLTRAVHRCVGVGKCRADNRAAGGFMCPSYLATRDEKDSTRGRARVLQEAINGRLVTGLDSAEVLDSLDLCLSCKACSRDCPADVDMARYKSEVLHRTYRGRRRPRSHYTLGQLPRWATLIGLLPRLGPLLANAGMRVRPLEKLLLRLAGVDPRRRAPRFAPVTFRAWWRRRPRHRDDDRPAVVLWVDTFSDGFRPDVARAAVSVLERAGFHVQVPRKRVCCGLTWISTGQLDAARRRLTRLVDELHPHARAGLPIVGLEPSCTAVLRSDLTDLVADPRAREVAARVVTLAELLDGSDWSPPDLSGVCITAQPHCHHHAVMGYETDRRLLAAAGARVDALAGCCGLAGNFGMEKGHYDVSVAVAENALLPALRRDRSRVLLTDGFSCLVQAQDLAGVTGRHLAEILEAGLSGQPPEPRGAASDAETG